MAGDDGAHALRCSVLSGKLQSFGIHPVDRLGGGHELQGQGLERSHVDLCRVEEADCAVTVGVGFDHRALTVTAWLRRHCCLTAWNYLTALNAFTRPFAQKVPVPPMLSAVDSTLARITELLAPGLVLHASAAVAATIAEDTEVPLPTS